MEQNNRDLYIIEETEKNQIGMGAFGYVYECKRKDGNDKEPLCVKVIKKKGNNKYQSQKEVNILKKIKEIKSENLLRIDQIFDSQYQFEIIMERCDMDLEQEFKDLKTNNVWYTDQDCFNIVAQIANGSRVLYQNNIVHRDIKPANILVKVENRGKDGYKRVYKIADFGFSKILENYCEPDYLTSMGTPNYASPQVFNNQPFSGKCDIYSFGLLFYQIFFQGNMPVVINRKEDLLNFYRILQNKQFKCQLPNYTNAEQITDLLQKMIVYREDERISFDQFYQHPILKIKKEHQFTHSVFNQNNVSKKSEVSQKEFIYKLLDRVYQLQVQLYRKYLFYKSICQKLSNNQQIYKKAALFCLSYLGYKQLLYCLGFIHVILSDIHPILKMRDIPFLLQNLQQCARNIHLHHEYQQYTKKIRKQYFTEKRILDNLINQLQKDFNLIQGSVTNINSFIDFFKSSKDKRIEQKQIMDILKYFLSQKLLDGFEDIIQTAIDLDDKFPIQNYQNINPDDIFKE